MAAKLASNPDPALNAIGLRLAAATAALQSAIDWIVQIFGSNPRAAHASSVPYLELWGLCAGGWQMGRAAIAATEKLQRGAGDAAFLRAKIATARFYAECLLPQADAYSQSVVGGSASVLAIPAEQL